MKYAIFWLRTLSEQASEIVHRDVARGLGKPWGSCTGSGGVRGNCTGGV